MLSLLLIVWTVSAQTEATAAAAEQMERGGELITKGDYASSLEMYKQACMLLEKAGLESDSLYYTAWTMMGKCYYRMQNIDEAIQAVKQAKQLYAQYRDTTKVDYAHLLDNLCLYCSSD